MVGVALIIVECSRRVPGRAGTFAQNDSELQ